MLYSHIEEEYDSLLKSPWNDKVAHPVYKNPDKSEISDLSKTTDNVRFISHKKNMYVWDGSILHRHAIRHLNLPISSSPLIKDAFLGVAKPNSDGTLAFDSTEQRINEPIHKYHSHILQYFK
jgi:hypothetical protein